MFTKKTIKVSVKDFFKANAKFLGDDAEKVLSLNARSTASYVELEYRVPLEKVGEVAEPAPAAAPVKKPVEEPATEQPEQAEQAE